jgi:hypothetical protein
VTYYGSLETLKHRLSVTGTSDDALLEDALNWARRYIDGYCDRRTYGFASTTATRYFGREHLDPRDRSILWLDEDLVSVTTLTNGDSDATVLASSTYWLWTVDGRNGGPPYYGLKLKSDYAWEFDTDQFVSVLGAWGYSSAPDDLVLGCAYRLGEFHYRSRAPQKTTTIYDGSVRTEKLEGFPKDVLMALDQRKRWAR